MTRYHLIGIGGTGISAIARVLAEMGHTVSGSDRAASPFTADLQAAGVTVHIGHRPENILGADVVVRSSAIQDDNPEVTAARQSGIPVLKRADFLGTLMEGKTGIAVAGTHGKTTTTSMIAWMLTALGEDPSFISGGVLKNLGVNAHAGKGSTFVIEADEYDRMFLGLKPTIGIITNVEHDHPDCYPSAADFLAAFIEFALLVPENGTLVYCREDPGACQAVRPNQARGRKTLAYGWSSPTAAEPAFATAADISAQTGSGFRFRAVIGGESVQVSLQVPGRHNVLNALAALGTASLLELDLPAAAQALEQFSGTGRRFELRGEAGGVTVIDDYAHHPTEIRATLEAAHSTYPGRRIWAVWQPHTYSRTKALFNDFVSAFKDADEVIVTDVYKARERQEEFSSAELVQAMPIPAARHIAELPQVTAALLTQVIPGDVVLVLSAGDADQVSTNLLAQLKEAGNG